MLRLSLFSNLNYRHCRILAIAWMVLIFIMSSQSSVPVSGGWGQDKLMHFICYGILGFMLARSFKNAQEGLSWKQIALVSLIAFAYGASDEFHQSFVPGREASLGDLLADTLGGIAGAMLLRRKTVS